MTEKPRLEVCLSPALLNLYDTNGVLVVIIDIFRATSTIVTALDNGAECVIPVAAVAECIQKSLEIPNSITAGERDGKIAEGLQYGNSPLEFHRGFIQGKSLILTTTNGTRLLHKVEGAADIVIGSFLNISAVADYISKRGLNVLLGCASWKDRVNLEDTLFAGALIAKVEQHFNINCDSARIAKNLFSCCENVPVIEFLKDSSHYKRLSGFGLEADMEYCAQIDVHSIVPVLRGEKILVA
jgi:2-phosphosulfolactate phosphatase